MTIYFLFQVCLIGIGNKIVQHMWNQFLFFISLLCAPCLPLSKLCVSYSSCCYFQYGPVCSQAQPLLPSLNYNQRLTHSVHSHVLMTFGTVPITENQKWIYLQEELYSGRSQEENGSDDIPDRCVSRCGKSKLHKVCSLRTVTYQILTRLTEVAKLHTKRNSPPEASTHTNSILMRYCSSQHRTKQFLTFFPTPVSFSCSPDPLCCWVWVSSNRTSVININSIHSFSFRSPSPYFLALILWRVHSYFSPMWTWITFSPFLKRPSEGTYFRVACCLSLRPVQG